MNGIFVIGPAKSGTTLMISLLDNHPDLSVIPLEVKFYEHYCNTLHKSATYEELNDYFFNVSKLKLMDPSRYQSVDKMTSGRTDFHQVDFKLFSKNMNQYIDKCKLNKKQGQIFSEYLTNLHKAFSISIGNGNGKETNFAAKEGNHGLPYIKQITKDFPYAKFIIMVRDPRDMYASFKLIKPLVKSGANYPSLFFADLSFSDWLFGNRKKSCMAYMDYFEDISASKQFCFVRYEDLVNDTKESMVSISNFLGLQFNNTMLEPTTAGSLWGGNSSSEKSFSNVNSSRVGKWKDVLEEREIKLLDYFLEDYIKKHGYKIDGKKISIWRVISSIRSSDFSSLEVNIKDFFRPYVRIARYLMKIGLYFLTFIRRIGS
jgi:hypothetical protein